MKKLADMTQAEIKALDSKEFSNISPFEKKSCADCAYLKGYVTWWCTNAQAKEDRGTSIPGCILCPHWSPNWEDIPARFKTLENGYIKKPITVQRINWFEKIVNFFK